MQLENKENKDKKKNIQTEKFPFLEIERGVRIEALELCMKFFSNVLLLVIPCIHKDCILIGKLQS